MRARFVAVGCAWLLACEAEQPERSVEPIELAENCGQTEPIRLLRYAPWRKVQWGAPVGIYGDRRLLGVHYFDTLVAPDVLYSVGLCGEQPKQLLSGRFSVWTPPGQDWPFAFARDGDLHVIDPSGARAPKRVARLPSFGHWTDDGIFTIRGDSDESTGELVGYWWPDDIWADDFEPVLLHDSVKIAWNALQGSYDELFFMTADDELARLSLDDGQLEIVATDVHSFAIGRERDDSPLGSWPRYVLWQDIEMSNHDVEHPEGEVRLLDRVSNQVSSLGHSALDSASRGATNWSASGIVQLPMHVDDEWVLRLFQLPSLSHVDVPITIEPWYMLDDDLHLIVRFGEQGPFGTLDVQTGETLRFADYFTNPRGAYWHEQRAYALLSAAGQNELAEGEMWLIDGGDPPKLIANRATLAHQLMPDGRLLTGINLDGNMVGDLIVVDDFEERLIDHDVRTSYLSTGPSVGEDMVSYSILQGERAGLWLARLPPAN